MLFTIAICLTRVIIDDLIIPLFLERKFYADKKKMEVARRIQVLMGTVTDFLVGVLLLYLF